MKIDRNFVFRGDRRYLQSATLFDDLISRRGPDARDIDFRFARKTAKQVSYLDGKPDAADVLVAEWSDACGHVYVVERDESIDRSEPYDEAALVARLSVTGRDVDVPPDIGSYSRIDAMVAAFKHLLQRVYPDVARKYVFVRIRLARMPQGPVRIHYARDIGRFFQGDILEEGTAVGQIFFGIWS